MANEVQLAILRSGVAVWNQWRAKHLTHKSGLRAADFSDASLNDANLQGANLSNANLSGTYLGYANLKDSDLGGANLSNAFLGSTILDSAYLYHANLAYSYLNRANLVKANLDSAILKNAEIGRANLQGANLFGADLREANLSGANLRNASLKRADLRGANLTSADLRKADLAEADFGLTMFGDVDLSIVKGLDESTHRGPSYIDVRTIYASKGNIPESFLRGAGIDDTFITFMQSLTSAAGFAIDYYSCFISYSSKDEELAKRIHADLQNINVRCWYAPEDLKIGEKIRQGIDQAIRVHDKLLLLLSENSVNSKWVESEVEAALEQERQHDKLILFPIRLDSAVMDTHKAWASDIRRQRHIGDFTQWKDHDSYRKAFDRLLHDLKEEKQST